MHKQRTVLSCRLGGYELRCRSLEKAREREKVRERIRKSARKRERDGERERERDKERDRERERQRERDRERNYKGLTTASQLTYAASSISRSNSENSDEPRLLKTIPNEVVNDLRQNQKTLVVLITQTHSKRL